MSAHHPTLHVIEPPAHYLTRPPVVVDCSALAGLVFREAWEAEARQRLAGRALHAPHLLYSELASVAVKKQRRGEAHAADGLAAAAAMAIDLHPIDPLAVTTLALDLDVSAYDASYLWLASFLKCPLATFDDRLAAAARNHLPGLS